MIAGFRKQRLDALSMKEAVKGDGLRIARREEECGCRTRNGVSITRVATRYGCRRRGSGRHQCRGNAANRRRRGDGRCIATKRSRIPQRLKSGGRAYRRRSNVGRERGDNTGIRELAVSAVTTRGHHLRPCVRLPRSTGPRVASARRVLGLLEQVAGPPGDSEPGDRLPHGGEVGARLPL